MSLGQTLRLFGAKIRGIFSKIPKSANDITANIKTSQIENDTAIPKSDKKNTNWKLLAFLLVLAILPIYYIAGAILTHKINDDLNFKVGAPTNGKSTTVQVIASLIKREVIDTKWSPNTQAFEPAALLRVGGNMVNFQSGIIRALSTTVYEMENRLARSRGSAAADADMSAARQGLSRSPETWILDPLPTSSADHEYKKARLALLRYNERLANGGATFEVRVDNLQGVLDHIALDLGGLGDSLDKQITQGRTVFIDTRADKLFYYAKGQSYAYFIVFTRPTRRL